jgi:hypothetical protein
MQVAGTPMFVVKAYLPVNESFGKQEKVAFIVKVWYLCLDCILSCSKLHDQWQHRIVVLEVYMLQSH